MLYASKETLSRLSGRYTNSTKKQRAFLVSAFAVAFLLLVGLFSRPGKQQPGNLHTSPSTANPYQSQKPERPPEVHPINHLITNGRSAFAEIELRQSRSLKDAVDEYRRRYVIDPPPYFDKWYDFAVEHGVPLIDEYDTINELLLPFWAFSPSALRAKARKGLGADDFVTGLFVRGGTVKSMDRGPEWKISAIQEAVATFASFLPDMDLMFNLHDEPRVVIPHDDLARLLARAQTVRGSTVTGGPPLRNSWSASPADLNDGFIEPYDASPFNEYAHQFTWTVSRSSCPSTSPARSLNYEDQPMDDNVAGYTAAPLNFVQNRTAFTEICNSPSLEQKYGFFNKPNAWSVTHELLPIFSPSKISSFQDILFPAAWYLAEKVSLDDEKDRLWEAKDDAVYWRGSTTSGYSDNGTWRRQHRQRFVEQIEQPGSAQILVQHEGADTPWVPKDVDRELFRHLYDVHFSSIGQCSPEDCASQEGFFDVRPMDDFQKASQYKFLLDIDGNAFSGRFYAFLRSRSLTLKLALFREWHEEFISPWAHYIPLGLDGSDHLEIVRFLTEEEVGKKLAQEVANESRDWAGRALRQVDMQAWMFRLLLE